MITAPRRWVGRAAQHAIGVVFAGGNHRCPLRQHAGPSGTIRGEAAQASCSRNVQGNLGRVPTMNGTAVRAGSIGWQAVLVRSVGLGSARAAPPTEPLVDNCMVIATLSQSQGLPLCRPSQVYRAACDGGGPVPSRASGSRRSDRYASAQPLPLDRRLAVGVAPVFVWSREELDPPAAVDERDVAVEVSGRDEAPLAGRRGPAERCRLADFPLLQGGHAHVHDPDRQQQRIHRRQADVLEGDRGLGVLRLQAVNHPEDPEVGDDVVS